MPKLKQNAIALLKADHRKVKDLFKQFEESGSQAAKAKIAQEAIKELKIHTVIEEEIFYPAVRQAIQDEDDIMNEAQEEHHVAKMLIAELERIGHQNEHFEAKFTVLAENVRHHIKEEEEEMLPEAKKTDIDFDALGEQMMERKQRLQTEGIPETEEEELIGVKSQ